MDSAANHSSLQSANKKKLSGYVGFANLPNQLHRQSVKRGFHFTLMIVGESGLGKSTLLETLFNARLYPDPPSPTDATLNELEFSAFSVDMEESGVRLQLTVVDTPGFGDLINNQTSCQRILDDIERRFDAYMKQEQLIVRPIMPTPLIASPDPLLGSDDMDQQQQQQQENNKNLLIDERVHACLYFIAPTGHGLKPLDLEFMKCLHQRVNIIPIISKSDTMTSEEIQLFKHRITDQLDEAGVVLFRPLLSVADVDPITLLADSSAQNKDKSTGKANEQLMSSGNQYHDTEWMDECRKLDQSIPFACCGSMNEVDVGGGRRVRGRKYPWGVIEVDNEQHNDFIKLRQLLVRTHMNELKFRTESVLYERYRTQKKLGLITGSMTSLSLTDNDGQVGSLMKFEEERRQHDLKMKKLEVEMREVFEQKVAEKEAKMRQNEQELFTKHRESLEQIEKKRQELEERRRVLISEGASLVNASIPSATSKEKSGKTKKGLFK